MGKTFEDKQVEMIQRAGANPHHHIGRVLQLRRRQIVANNELINAAVCGYRQCSHAFVAGLYCASRKSGRACELSLTPVWKPVQ